MWSSWSCRAWLVGWLGSVNRHNPKESIKVASLWPNSSVPVHLPKKGLYITVHSSFVITIKSWKQLICSSTGRETNCGIFIYLFHGILLSNEKKGTIDISNMVTGTQKHCWEKEAETKRYSAWFHLYGVLKQTRVVLVIEIRGGGVGVDCRRAWGYFLGEGTVLYVAGSGGSVALHMSKLIIVYT